MNPYRFVILALALVWFQPAAALSATKLTIGHSTINPRIAPLWVAQEKGYFQKYGIDATLVFVRNTPFDDRGDEGWHHSGRLWGRERHPGGIGY
ncbi:MAG TPA: ABC transporter substrate-binding protein [Candidatus Binatia bacterium]|jgi:ABC-type nitrate/sulfonate/bicarbonate transport system substrate-binding protein